MPPASALLGYAEHTQGRALSHVQGLQVVRSGELIELPQTTRRNLELTQTLRGEDSPTLFSLLDTCTTGMGSRALKSWLLTPRRDRAQAAARASTPSHICAAARSKPCAPSSKAAATWNASPPASRCARCGPRELVALKDTLQKAELAAPVRQRFPGTADAHF